MSNKRILMDAALKKARDKHTHKIPSISFDYKPIFPNCTFWEHQNPRRYVNRIPMDTFSIVKVYLGCPFSRMPTFVESIDYLESIGEKYDFQALNNCKGAECEWHHICEEKLVAGPKNQKGR